MSLALPLVVRAATRADVPALNNLIAASARALSVGFYTPEQIEAAVKYVFGVDTGLVDDGTYYVVEVEGQIDRVRRLEPARRALRRRSATDGTGPPPESGDRASPHPRLLCRARVGTPGHRRPIARGVSRSRRGRGVQSFELMATLPGVPLYERFGFREVERVTDRMPSGVVLEFVRMRR